jgi:molybdopterin-containing oxidoreductase family iron-sulfur binding subunit
MKSKEKLLGKDYWRSLNQLADDPKYKEFLENEFPDSASEMKNPVSRRKFLTLMGASAAFAGLASCRRPVEKIVPYVKAPANVTPGKSLQYATAMPFGLSAYGLLVESHVGRPTKIEGNEKHPLTMGKSNPWAQASILNLYDPDRADKITENGSKSSWALFTEKYQELFKTYSENDGAGLAVLTAAFHSPTMKRLQKKFVEKFPKAAWVSYDPVSDENILNGIQAVTGGKRLAPKYDFSKADVVLAIDSDFMATESEDLSAAKGFASGRKVETKQDKMNRLYVVENMYTSTGSMADHRLRLQSGQMGQLLYLVGEALKNIGADVKLPTLKFEAPAAIDRVWVKAVAKDLLKNKGKSLVVVGRKQPAYVQAMAVAINHALSNTGSTVNYLSLDDASPSSTTNMVTLNNDMMAGKVETLIMVDVNPVYNAPANLNFKNSLKKVTHKIQLSAHVDETSAEVNWHLPLAHYLESWGDVRSIDGVRTVIQPLIEPLMNGIRSVQFLNLVVTGKDQKAYKIVQETWKEILGEKGFDKRWRKVLHEGVYTEDLNKYSQIEIRSSAIADLFKDTVAPNAQSLEVVFAADPSVFDGRYANNGWLQETPDPVSKLTWDNPALISPKTAAELGYSSGDLVRMNLNGKSIEIAAWISPGHADNSITLLVGYGRKNLGRIANNVGFNVYPLRNSHMMDFGVGLTIQPTGRTYPLANTQDHGSMEGRPLVREASKAEFDKNPKFASEMVKHPPLKSLWEEHQYDEGYQWGMTIDLNACNGCNACTVACQSENNISIVGKEEVSRGREMHWIRMDRYYAGDMEEPEMVYQPVNCQHCEMAPCEQVCPVAATSHDEEGLNVMTYNRCVGTRYCANNCPYKVRRFNFFNFTKDLPEIVKMAQNPDVSVRSRGVMEKCTFCTQRINQAKISAKNENRKLDGNEVVTACQQSCPTDAITFGNLLDPKSDIAKAQQSDRGYALLAELNLKPRVTYLAKLRNPNPELS